MGRYRVSARTPFWRIGLAATELLVPGDRLLPEERLLVADAGPRRLAEFATGRECARLALSRLGAGAPRTAVLCDARGAPSWPRAVVGSIAHCAGWTGAVTARAGGAFTGHGLRGIGLDAEPRVGLPAGVLDVIASEPERATVTGLATEAPGIPWETVLFCAKEATYKAWYPRHGEVLDHDAVQVSLSASGSFTAAALGVRGRWTAGPRVVVTIAVLT